MSNWQYPWDYPLPNLSDPGVSMADYMLAYDVRSSLLNASLNFLSSPDQQYANPQAYLMNMIRYAVSLTQNNYSTKYAPPTWDAVGAGFKYAFSAFEYLKQLPVNAGDPATVSVYDAWVAAKGQLYGGHDPIPVTGGTDATGQRAVTGPSIL